MRFWCGLNFVILLTQKWIFYTGERTGNLHRLWETKKAKTKLYAQDGNVCCKFNSMYSVFYYVSYHWQFETNNSVEFFVSNACKTSLLQHIDFLIKSKFWGVICLWFWSHLAIKYAFPDFMRSKNMLNTVDFYWIVCFLLFEEKYKIQFVKNLSFRRQYQSLFFKDFTQILIVTSRQTFSIWSQS